MEISKSLYRIIMGLIYVILVQSYEVDDISPDTSYVPYYISLNKEKAYNIFLREKIREHKHIFRPRDEFELEKDTETEYEFYLGNWFYSIIFKEFKLDEEL